MQYLSLNLTVEESHGRQDDKSAALFCIKENLDGKVMMLRLTVTSIIYQQQCGSRTFFIS